MTQHVGMHPRHPHASREGQMSQPAGGGVAVHSSAERVAQDRTVGAVVGGTFDCPGYCWRQRDQNDLAAFAPHAQDAVAVLFAEVGDVRPARFEDPQSEQAEKGDESEVVRVGRQPGGGDQRFELQVAEAEGRRLGWDGGTADVVGG